MVFFPMRTPRESISRDLVSAGPFWSFSSSSRSSLAFCLVVRALQPRFAHSSSMRRRLLRFRSEASSISSRSALRLRNLE